MKRAVAVALLLLASCGTEPPERTPEPTSPQDPITAVCEDGYVSFAKSRQGACSGHGGVARWLGDPNTDSAG